MRIRSYESLDFALAWRRVLHWAQGGSADSMDRLPFETHVRLDEPPRVDQEHHVSRVVLTMASKKSGTFRPFVRIDPADLLLYQALVDALGPAIEDALSSRDRVMAYRQTLDSNQANPFAGSSSFVDYASRVDQIVDELTPPPPLFPLGPAPNTKRGFILSTDISGYFLHVDVDELERSMLALASPSDVVRDLGDLLRQWHLLGIRGLPQGVRPSAPLGNLYLAPMDQLLNDSGVNWARWMDDVVIGSKTFSEARRILDSVERLLYERGLMLNSAKTSIKGAGPLASPISPHSLARRKEATLAGIAALIEAGYLDEDDAPDPEELDRDLAIEEVDSLLDGLTEDSFPERFQSRMISVLRDLEELTIAHRLLELRRVITRAPDLIYPVLHYAARVAEVDLNAATSVFIAAISADHYLRDYERLAVCRAAMGMPPAPDLASGFAGLALNDSSEFVRARALLAWGLHSHESDFEVADEFWARTTASWKLYAFVAIQRKMTQERDARYSSWSAEGRFLGRLGAVLAVQPIRWSRT